MSVSSGERAAREPRRHIGVVVARIRLPLLYAAVVLLVLDVGERGFVPSWLVTVLFLGALFLAYRGPEPGSEPVGMRPPVLGEWQAVHTPAQKVPSHGIHAYAQTYAFDLLRPHEVRSSPWWPLAHRPEAYPAFGEPVVAVADGTVVRVWDWQRDHRSRDSLPMLPFVLVEGALRDCWVRRACSATTSCSSSTTERS